MRELRLPSKRSVRHIKRQKKLVINGQKGSPGSANAMRFIALKCCYAYRTSNGRQ